MTKKPLTVLSLFDGISCARVALKRARITVKRYYASEVDKYAIEIAQARFPDTIQLGDITNITGKGLHKIDLIIGGSPCQDLSIAKANRQGLKGARSGLFMHYARLVKKLKPKYFILENVNSMPKEAKAYITKVLGVEPIMINAALVSAQNRKRLFWTNIPHVSQPKDRGILLKDILEDGGNQIAVQYNRKEGIKKILDKSVTISASDWRGLNRNQDQTAVFQYRRTYWRKTTGGKVPTLTANMGTGGHNVPFVSMKKDGSLRVREATKKGFAVAKDGDAVDLSFPNSKTRRGRVGNKVKNIMTGSGGIHVYKDKSLRKLTPVECERLQSLPDNYTEGVSATRRYHALGNAFNVDVVAHILKHI